MVSRRPFLQTSLALVAAAIAVAGAIAWRLSIVRPVSTPAAASFYDLTARDGQGHNMALSAYSGHVALVVNVASECGLVILAFPSDDFWQEPNDDAGIQQVCDARGVTFPVFGKGHVRGEGRSAVYDFLTSTGEAPAWNFAKYLVGRDGRVRAFFGSLVSADDAQLISAIEQALGQPMLIEAGRE
ncbi:MAG: glutathione peroxidase [Acidobacteria bacterium]|nr:glutathione peroxidase [Acidobacteriota bacterium]